MKETKAERLAREEKERNADLLLLTETYPKRLMGVLERACRVNFELVVEDGEFVVTDDSNQSDGIYRLSFSYTDGSQMLLDGLMWIIGEKEAVVAESDRVWKLRCSAMSKLSHDERVALGL